MHKSSKTSKTTRKPGDGKAFLQQMGLQMPNFDGTDMMNIPDDDDGDLEAELNRLQHGSDSSIGRAMGTNSRNKRGANNNPANLQAFHNDVNQLLRNIDAPIKDEDLSDIDENDLMAELNELTEEFQHEDNDQPKKPVAASTDSKEISTILEQRKENYIKAIAAAKTNNDPSKARRLERMLKIIDDMIKTVRAGGTINENDIPSPVFLASDATNVRATIPEPVTQRVQPQPKQPVPTLGETADSDPAIERLKALALQANRMGDKSKAKEYLLQIRTLREGVAPQTSERETYDNLPEDVSANYEAPMKAPEPKSALEALEQRYKELHKSRDEANQSGNSTKARRLERVAKQYEEAIQATKKGQPYDYGTLPDIPGFGPIPVSNNKPATTASSPPGPKLQPLTTTTVKVASSTMQKPVASATTVRKSHQVQELRSKQEQFHQLAAQAKRRGDIETAKKFLIAERGLEQMIEAANNGLPIDMSQIPKLPDEHDTTINDDDLTEDLGHADRNTIYRRLQDDLIRQKEICARNQQICMDIEQESSNRKAHEYKVLEERCAHDLEKLRTCFQLGLKPPLFHYERRQMTIIQSNDALGENDLEVTVMRGINLPVPSGISANSLETYVVIEFPYPTDEPQLAKTRHATGSLNAEYPDGQHKFYIKRSDAKFRRLMSRKEMKFMIYFKPGFLRSDRPLGLASLKLAEMENVCTIHESVDLYEAEHRKKIEGKLEVKLRIKEALGQTKASDILPQRWLIIDRFEDIPHSSKTSSSKSAPEITSLARLVPTGDVLSKLALNMGNEITSSKSDTESRAVKVEVTQRPKPSPVAATSVPISKKPQSIHVLNYEAKLLQEQIKTIENRITPDQRQQLESKLRSIEDESDRLTNSLRTGGKAAIREHVKELDNLADYYEQEARQYLRQNERKKADIAMEKKKLVVKEIDTLGGLPPTISSTRL